MMASTTARPAEALANDVTSGGASLNGEPPALAWLSMSLGFPMGQAPLGPVGSRSKALRWALPPCGVFGHGDGRVPASDALCRSLFEGEPGPLPPPPRQKDDDLFGPERLPSSACPFRLLSHGGEGRRADVCNLYDSRARPGSPEPRSATLRRLPSPACFFG